MARNRSLPHGRITERVRGPLSFDLAFIVACAPYLSMRQLQLKTKPVLNLFMRSKN